MNEDKYISYFLMVVGLVCVAAAYLLGSGAVLLFALVLNIAGLVMYRAGGLVLNAVFPGFNVHPSYREFELVGDVAVTLGDKGVYHAVKYLELLLRQRLGEMTPSQQGEYLRCLNGYFTSLRIPAKTGLLIYQVDHEGMRDEYRRKIEGAKEAEERCGRHGDARGVEEAARKRMHYERILRELEARETYDALCYACVSAEDGDKERAVEKANGQAARVALAISTAFDGRAQPIAQEILLRVLAAEGYPSSRLKKAAA